MRLSLSPLSKGILMVGTGTIITQLISLLILPILTRMYTPSDFGIYSTFISLLGIIIIFSTLRYEFAFVMPELEERAIALVALALLLHLIMTFILSLLLFVFGNNILIYFGLPKNYVLFILLIMGFFLIGLFNILSYWCIRERNYYLISKVKITQGIIGSITKLPLGMFSIGSIGLIIGQIISQGFGVASLISNFYVKFKNNLKNLTFINIKNVAKDYRKFPLFDFPSSIVNTIAISLPSIALIIIYDSTTVGYYTLAYSIILAPATLVAGSVSQPFLGELSELIRNNVNTIKIFYIKTIKKLTVISIVIITPLAFIAPLIITPIFGQSWSDAGVYCIPLAIIAIPRMIASPTSRLSMYGFNHWGLILDMVKMLSVIVVFLIASSIKTDVLTTLYVYAIIILINNVINIFFNIEAIKRWTKNIYQIN